MRRIGLNSYIYVSFYALNEIQTPAKLKLIDFPIHVLGLVIERSAYLADVSTYTYIYIYREREKERERDR